MDIHNFKLVVSWDLVQHQAQGRLYRHSSGMEVFHVEADMLPLSRTLK